MSCNLAAKVNLVTVYRRYCQNCFHVSGNRSHCYFECIVRRDL